MIESRFIEKLLNGRKVEWKSLEDIAEIYGGLSGKTKSDFENGNAKYITYKNVFDNIEINFDILETVKITQTETQHKVKYGDVLFTASSETANDVGMSSVVTKEIEYDVYLNSFSFGLRFNENIKIIPEYSKYLFRTYSIRNEISKTASGVTRFNISKARFKKIIIPIPPIDVQQEIVRILDAFTSLTAELTAELTSRQKQYQYFRDKLLNFDDISDRGGYETNSITKALWHNKEVVFKALGEVGTLIRGNGLQKKDFTEVGVPAIHYGQIYTYYGLETNKTLSFVSTELAQKLRKVDKGDVVITNTSENLEDVGKAVAYFGEEQAVTGGHATIFKPSNEILTKFFVYLTLSPKFIEQKRKLAKGTKVIDVSATDMAKIKVPIPDLQTQQKIVEILDKFEHLTNSITEGLPKEIELRRKQYEYYREQLLSFPQ
ncbi:restriction endonuclease subunit S [Glaesserella parasuis]|nr:restriction endonuclease subunit S [Glaesserella parasuis]